MILFVFEGDKVEPKIFESIENLHFGAEKIQIIKYGSDLPTLYAELRKNEYDLFSFLTLKEYGIQAPEGKRLDTLFSQVFLFFDYDFQNRMGVEPLNEILGEMLEFFDDETENGKLYINYPMVESLKYTKELPDENYWRYEVSRQVCVEHRFKRESESFAFADAKGFRFLNVRKHDNAELRNTWKMLIHQNVCKANYIISGDNSIPSDKADVNQKVLFAAQVSKYVTAKESVAILNSFPLFLYEYFR